MSSFILKIIAVISMFCDHFGDSFIKHFSFLNLLGRMSFPIFAFQISEGYIHTKNLKKYFFRLLIFALASQLPFYLFLQKFLPSSTSCLNIFFTLLLGLTCIKIYDIFNNLKNNFLESKVLNISLKNIVGFIIVLIIAYIGELLHVDYGAFGIIVVFSFYLFKNNKLAMVIFYIFLCVIRYGIYIILTGFNITYIYICIFCILPILFISLYNGKQGYKIKYFLYFFYPVHFLMLYFLF